MDGEIRPTFREFHPNCTVADELLTNGMCDGVANVEECAYDVGDCCMHEGNDYDINIFDADCYEDCFCHKTQNLHF